MLETKELDDYLYEEDLDIKVPSWIFYSSWKRFIIIGLYFLIYTFYRWVSFSKK